MGKKIKDILLSRFILVLTTPLILFNVLCAVLVIVKNWSLRNTRELDV